MEWETFVLEVQLLCLKKMCMDLLRLSQQDAKQRELQFNYEKWLFVNNYCIFCLLHTYWDTLYNFSAVAAAL